MYQLISDYISRPLTEIINNVILTNTFPDIWKIALVTPVPKPGNKANPSNYRPISSLPILSKVAEKIITIQMRHYLETNSLISPRQYGFRQAHSTQSLLLQLTDKWLKTLDKKTGDRYICLTALDIKKAFDTVHHDTLLCKLANLFNFHPSSAKLICSYLSTRQQVVKVNNELSSILPVLSGVPQGSILGPLLFITFINDITTTCSCYLFADDCIVEQTGSSPNDVITKTNQILPNISNWYSDNLLKINTGKTSVILISNKSVNTQQLNPVQVQGINATYTQVMKYLGMYINNSLNWNDHVRLTKNKVMPVVWNFAKIRHLIDLNTARVFYISIIRPLLEYAAPVIHNMSTTNVNIFEKIQNKCLRIIAQSPPQKSSHILRKQLNIPTITDRRNYLYLCEFFKLQNNLSPKLQEDNITNVTHQTAYTLRSTTHANIFLPRMNKSAGQRSLSYLGPHLFNSLPLTIKTSPSFRIFKSRLKKHYLLN